jgi:hypothetical protein
VTSLPGVKEDKGARAVKVETIVSAQIVASGELVNEFGPVALLL